VAARIGGVVRQGEVAGRWGGEEFVVLLPDTTEAEAAVVGERLRAAVEASSVRVRSATVCPTVSVGVAASASLDAAALVQAADEALYRAKQSGRNRVVRAAALVPVGSDAQ
jgi:diguanylate cyclase (GGDEF)-like protein